MKVFFTPGPSQIYPSIPRHLAIALKKNILSWSHRSSEFEQMLKQTKLNLKKILSIPRNHEIFFLSSGTECMERVIENTVAKHSFHLINGAFSQRFFQTSLELQKKAQKIEVKAGQGFIFDQLKIPSQTELICFTQNETSTGVALPMEDIYRLKKRYPKKLIALDIVSSAPYIQLDFRWLDLVFFSVQKGFGLPAGLGVLMVSPQAMRKSRLLVKKNPQTFHSFNSLLRYSQKNQTPETANVLGIYLLGKVSQDMRRLGIKKIRKQTQAKAKLIYDFLEKSPDLTAFVPDRKWQSATVIVAEVKGGSESLIRKLRAKGLIVGSGYKEFKNQQIRIANFPSHRQKDIKQLLKHLVVK